MKKFIRFFTGFVAVAPFAVLTYFFAIFMGKQKAVKELGPFVTFCAKLLQQFFPPKITSASQFDIFKEKVQPQYMLYKLWSMLYDYEVKYPDKNSVLLELKNCPFAEALSIFKLTELGHAMCQGDWEVAKDNKNKWEFERAGTIGTGCKVCDFKYKRIQS